MLHRNYTAAYRALDSKWGSPVDLISSEESMSFPCLPAVIDKPATTFSSEDYLKKIRRRPTPYSRKEVRSRKRDSFSNISLARYQDDSKSTSDYGGSSSSLELKPSSTSDYGGSSSSLESKPSEPSLMEELSTLIEDLKKPLDDSIVEAQNEEEVETALQVRKEELDNTFKRLKKKAFAYVEQKFKNRSA